MSTLFACTEYRSQRSGLMREGRGEARAWLITPLGAGKRTPVARIERRDAGGGSGDCAVFVGLCARWVRDAGWLNLKA